MIRGQFRSPGTKSQETTSRNPQQGGLSFKWRSEIASYILQGVSVVDNASKSPQAPILTDAVYDEIHQVLEERFQKDLRKLEREVKNPRTHPLRWLSEFLLVVLVGLNGIICYQLWQQSEILDALSERDAAPQLTLPQSRR